MGKRGKKGGRGGKKSLINRARELRVNSMQKAAQRKREEVRAKAKKQRKQKEERERATIPYKHSDSTLLIGEGDFSFAAALSSHFAAEKKKKQKYQKKPSKLSENEPSSEEKGVPLGGGTLEGGGYLIATCLDDFETLEKKYPTARANLTVVRETRGYVVDKVDCTELKSNLNLRDTMIEGASRHSCAVEGFSKIIFNFPHTGCGIKDTQKNNEIHRKLLEKFLASAFPFLLPSGEIHITLKRGQPYDSWGLPSVVRNHGGLSLKYSYTFYPELYKGYRHRRTLGAQSNEESKGGPEANRDIIGKGARTYVIVPKV
ncbi:hypothetical protein AAMO2058_001525900 [Amorphochlora amoebiformis]